MGVHMLAGIDNPQKLYQVRFQSLVSFGALSTSMLHYQDPAALCEYALARLFHAFLDGRALPTRLLAIPDSAGPGPALPPAGS